ncbi:MAG: hypothetical protein ACOCRX_00860 [Candidatus Woesearchaeota archaeon]
MDIHGLYEEITGVLGYCPSDVGIKDDICFCKDKECCVCWDNAMKAHYEKIKN